MADPKITTKIPEKKYNPSNTTGPDSNLSKKPTVVFGGFNNITGSKDVGSFTELTKTTNSAPETKTSGSPVPTDTFSIFDTCAMKDARSRAERTAERTARTYTDAYAGASSLPSAFGVSTATSTAQSKVYLNNAQAMAGEAKSWMDQAANCYASDPTKAKALYEKAEKRLLEAQKMLKNAEAEGATLQDLAQTSQDVYHFLYQCRQNNVSGYDINASLGETAETGFWQNVANSLPSILPNLIQGLMGGSGKTDSSGNTTRTNQTPSSGSSSGSTSFSGASSKELKVSAGYENLPDVVKAKKNYSESQGRIDEATGAIAEAKGNLDAAEAQKKALGDEIDDLEDTSRTYAKEYMDLKSEQAKHIQEQKKYEQIKQQKTTLANEYGDQINDKKNGELTQAKDDVVRKNTALEAATKRVDAAELAVTNAENKLSSAKTDEDKIAAENLISAAKRKLEDAKKEKADAEKELEIAQNKVAKIEEEIKVLEKHRDTAQKEAQEAEKLEKTAAQNANNLEDKIKEIGEKVSMIESKIENLKGRIDECFKNMNAAQATIDTNSTIIDCEEDKQDAAQDLADVAVQRAQKDKYIQEGGLINGIVAWW